MNNNLNTSHLFSLFIRNLFIQVRAVGPGINRDKSNFGKQFCHEVGNGNVKPNVAKVASIGLFPPPTDHKSLLRFLGMAGFFRRFCKNLLM